MVNRNYNIQPASGFSVTQTEDGLRFLLPSVLADTLENERVAAIEAAIVAKAEAQKAKANFRASPPPSDANLAPNELACIRLNTNYDLADATALAARILKKSLLSMDNATAEFSNDLFVAVALYVAYTEKTCTLKAVLDFIADPCWDSARQMLQCFRNSDEAFQQKEAKLWLKGFMKKTDHLTHESAESMVKRCHFQWQAALSSAGKIAKEKKKPRSIQVFTTESITKALALVGELKEEKKAGGERLLENARHDNGNRSVPDAQKAGVKLEAAKLKFENLVEPITRLQIDLILAGAMPPEDFRITPILLLGDPGIGKTLLATQLADALGVASEKISAGGASGGFQLAGSHTSWNGARPGSLFTLLAEGKSASPVIVVDEVDKIGNSNYPVLPVLLDLFEPGTARNFKDEFYEIQFDTSHIIFVLTANSLDGVPAPLLSRMEVFDVPRPEPEQRMRIIQGEAEQLRRKTKMRIELDKSDCENLADRTDLDLRKTTRLVKEAFSKAMVSGEVIAWLQIPKFQGRRAIGFGC